MTKKVSLKDIAQKAGVSTTLVSYVVNNLKSNRINKETARRIREIASSLNYRTNQVARSLKTNRTFTIGVIVADISNPFSANLVRIIEDEADRHGYTVLFGSSDENLQKFGKLLDTFVNRQVDGLILSPPAFAESQIQELEQTGLPFVLLDRYYADIKTSYVALDNFHATKEAVNQLIHVGRKKIGMITYQSGLLHLQERKRGYLSALEENNIEFQENWLKEIDFTRDKEEVIQALDEMQVPGSSTDAVLLASNNIATIGLKHINALRIKVPEDLAIISFDQSEMLDVFYSPVSYIKQPIREMGQKAMLFLIKKMDDPKNISTASLKSELIVRDSSWC